MPRVSEYFDVDGSSSPEASRDAPQLSIPKPERPERPERLQERLRAKRFGLVTRSKAVRCLASYSKESLPLPRESQAAGEVLQGRRRDGGFVQTAQADSIVNGDDGFPKAVGDWWHLARTASSLAIAGR